MFPFDGDLNGDGFGDDEYPWWGSGEEDSYRPWGSGEEDSYRSSYRSPPTQITCNRCGTKDLRWLVVNRRWQLVYGYGNLLGKLHACPEN